MKAIILSGHLFVIAVLACSIALIPARGADVPKMEMTTDIPASITAPDKVETRIGTLNFKDGFPDDGTVKKVYDNLDFQRAVQAYLFGLSGSSSWST
jgi:hypothetical protein